MKTTVALLKT